MAVCLAVSLVYVEPLNVVLASETVAKSKQIATEVFHIDTVAVEVDENPTVKRQILIKAKVLSVKRSSTPLMPGEVIEIDSCQLFLGGAVDPAGLDALIGPKTPPQRQPGWTGTVYLKAKDNGRELKRFGLAAFGHSFAATRLK